MDKGSSVAEMIKPISRAKQIDLKQASERKVQDGIKEKESVQDFSANALSANLFNKIKWRKLKRPDSIFYLLMD